MDRRTVLAGGAALGALLPAGKLLAADRPGGSIVPATRNTAPDYWCTWALQNYVFGQGAQSIDISRLEGGSGSDLAGESLTGARLLANNGWAARVHPNVRSDLILLVDAGWEENGMASFELDRKKFSGWAQFDATERMRRLDIAIRGFGWRGTGLWCRNPPGGAADEALVRRSDAANIAYWKIDVGDQSGNVVAKRNQLGSSLRLEHVNGEGAFNGNIDRDGRFPTQNWSSERARLLRLTDVYRTYDASAPLGMPTTLDRASQMLKAVAGNNNVRTLLNVEDEVIIAAALGCTMGVFRHQYKGLRPSGDPDLFFPKARNLKSRLDEVTRAARWHRIAPPFGAGIGNITLDSEILIDDYVFRRGECFDPNVVNRRVFQGAPARIARNCEMPVVTSGGTKPYVFCAGYPNGAASIGTGERIFRDWGVEFQRADVRWWVGSASGPIGIFGHYNSLTLQLSRPPRRAIFAQDLAGTTPVDVTSEVRVSGNTAILSGALIDRIGRQAQTPGDVSVPGLVLDI